MWFFDTIVEPVKTGAKSETATLEAESLLIVDTPEISSTPTLSTGDILWDVENTGDLIIIDDVPTVVSVDAVPDMVISEPEIIIQQTSDLVTEQPAEPTAESLFVLDSRPEVGFTPSVSSEVIAPEVTIARAISELSASEAYNGTLIQASLDRATALKAEKSETEAAHAREIERLQEEHTARMQNLDDQAQAALKEAEKIQVQGKKTARMLELLQAHVQS